MPHNLLRCFAWGRIAIPVGRHAIETMNLQP